MAALALALGALALLLLILLLVQRRRMRRLARQAEAFLAGQQGALPFSVREDALAPLHNGVAELEDAILVARSLRQEECRRTGDLMADISHQLKTPLASLRLFCEMDGGPHAVEETQLIDRMESLVFSLLRLERLCADGYAFDLREQEISRLAEQAWAALAPLYGQRTFTLTGRQILRCDGQWLEEVFLNLLKNACQHTREDGHIAVTLERTEQCCQITVSDDGGGVREEDLPHLFERFYRAEDASPSGSGIGLAMVWEIVHRHHGTILAENIGPGLAITLCLPLLQETMARS